MQKLIKPIVAIWHKLRLWRLFWCLPVYCAGCSFAFSSTLAVDENRYILEESKHKVAVQINNLSKEEALAQVSLDWGEPQQQNGDLPLAVSKPLLVIPAQQNQVLEVFYQGVGLPQDRETFFLLNILDVPPNNEADTGTVVRIAARHRFKLFYRPTLTVRPEAAREMLKLRLADDGHKGSVLFDNPSPYFVTLVSLTGQNSSGEQCDEVISHMMLAPYSKKEQLLPKCGTTLSAINYHYVTDLGYELPYKVVLKSG